MEKNHRTVFFGEPLVGGVDTHKKTCTSPPLFWIARELFLAFNLTSQGRKRAICSIVEQCSCS
jgi:hypothetical protein